MKKKPPITVLGNIPISQAFASPDDCLRLSQGDLGHYNQALIRTLETLLNEALKTMRTKPRHSDDNFKLDIKYILGVMDALDFIIQLPIIAGSVIETAQAKMAKEGG